MPPRSDASTGRYKTGCLLPGARQGRDPARAIKRGPSGLPPELVAATQRERLYDGLVHTVAEKGYLNARVTDICQAAGVTRPVFYELFAGKEDAFLATYRHGTEVLLGRMESAYQRASAGTDRETGADFAGPEDRSEWRDGLYASLATLLDVLAQVPVFAKMAIVEIDALGPVGRTERGQLVSRFHQFFADAPAPPPPADAAQLRTAVVGGVYSTVYEHIAGGRAAELPSRLPQVTYNVLVSFLGPRETAAYLHQLGERER